MKCYAILFFVNLLADVFGCLFWIVEKDKIKKRKIEKMEHINDFVRYGIILSFIFYTIIWS